MYSICCFQLIPPPLRIELVYRLFIFNSCSYWNNRGLFIDDLIWSLLEIVLEESFDKKEMVVFLFFFFYIYMGGLFWTFSSYQYKYVYVYMYSICCFQLIPLRIELVHRLFIFNSCSYWDNRGLFIDDLMFVRNSFGRIFWQGSGGFSFSFFFFICISVQMYICIAFAVSN